jgi:kynurenine 3-monooxygenase
MEKPQKIVVVGAGPVGSLAALYAAQRGHEVEVYELRPGKLYSLIILTE